jgi:hypothetical protein
MSVSSSSDRFFVIEFLLAAISIVWRAGGAPEFGSSARLFHTQKRQHRGVLVPEVASESVPRCEARRRDGDIALPCKAALVRWADVGNRRCDNG